MQSNLTFYLYGNLGEKGKKQKCEKTLIIDYINKNILLVAHLRSFLSECHQ